MSIKPAQRQCCIWGCSEGYAPHWYKTTFVVGGWPLLFAWLSGKHALLEEAGPIQSSAMECRWAKHFDGSRSITLRKRMEGMLHQEAIHWEVNIERSSVLISYSAHTAQVHCGEPIPMQLEVYTGGPLEDLPQQELLLEPWQYSDGPTE